MRPELVTTAASSSHSTLRPEVGSLATKAGSLTSIAPAFFLFGTGALAYPNPAPDYQPEQNWVHYERGVTSTTPSILDTLRHTSIEDLVIAKLDLIFESLLASQQDLEPADHRAIALKL